MAVAFGKSKGKAASGADHFKFEDGSNTFRLVGGVLPRYMYWAKTADNKPVPIECLHFNRDTETFDRKEKDWYSELFPYKLDASGNPMLGKTGEPEKNFCSWSYSMLCLTKDGEVKVMGLKKKMFAQIQALAKKLGDPTDLDTGWWVTVEKAKTGPLAYNVEYTVDQLTSSEGKRPLTDDEKAAVAEAKSIDALFPRPTPDAQHKFIREKIMGEQASVTTDDKEGANDL